MNQFQTKQQSHWYYFTIIYSFTTSALFVSSWTCTNKKTIRTTPLFLEKQQLGTFEPLNTSKTKRKVRILDYISQNNTLTFEDGYNIQRDLLNQQLERIEHNRKNEDHIIEQWYNDSNSSNQGYDCVMFLEHEPVYTLGRSSDPSFIFNNTNNVEISHTDRGGEVTYHGIGQLVVYPILDLRGYRKDIHWYIRALEEVILQTLRSMNLTSPSRSDDYTGIYILNQNIKSKIASIGIKSRRWVTMHGLAVNVNSESLENFECIVPCGLVGFNVTCVNYLGRDNVSVEEFKEFLIPAFEDVFRVTLVE